MLIVADSSPLIALVNIGHVSVLSVLFREVVVPRAVVEELRRPQRPQAVRDWVESRPTWLIERIPQPSEPLGDLHAGEQAAIALAIELAADLLLIDEREGRKVARALGIPVTGTVGVLESAAKRGLVDLAEAFRASEADRLLDFA